MFDELDIPISKVEITKAIKQLKHGKSGGPDLYINEIFKYSNDALLSYYEGLFNRILEVGHFPYSFF